MKTQDFGTVVLIKKVCTPSYNAVIFYKFVLLTLIVIDRGGIGTNHKSVSEIIPSIVCGWKGRESIEYGKWRGKWGNMVAPHRVLFFVFAHMYYPRL